MEERLIAYIRNSLPLKGDLTAFNILVHIVYELILENKTEDEIKVRIDSLLTDPIKRKK